MAFRISLPFIPAGFLSIGPMVIGTLGHSLNQSRSEFTFQWVLFYRGHGFEAFMFELILKMIAHFCPPNFVFEGRVIAMGQVP